MVAIDIYIFFYFVQLKSQYIVRDEFYERRETYKISEKQQRGTKENPGKSQQNADLLELIKHKNTEDHQHERSLFS